MGDVAARGRGDDDSSTRRRCEGGEAGDGADTSGDAALELRRLLLRLLTEAVGERVQRQQSFRARRSYNGFCSGRQYRDNKRLDTADQNFSIVLSSSSSTAKFTHREKGMQQTTVRSALSTVQTEHVQVSVGN